MASTETLLLLGRDHALPGLVEVAASADGRSACALSAGAGTRGGKHDPNEDAVLVLDGGRQCLIAVADAHFGASSSHRLLERIAAEVSPDVPNLFLLGEAIESLRDEAADPDDPSETTLVVVVLQRGQRRGFGIAFGDSSCVVLPRDGEARALAEKRPGFVTLARPAGLAREQGHAFRFLAGSGDLVAVYTDGVDECHYGRPRTSVRLRYVAAAAAETNHDPRTFVERLALTALEGVDVSALPQMEELALPWGGFGRVVDRGAEGVFSLLDRELPRSAADEEVPFAFLADHDRDGFIDRARAEWKGIHEPGDWEAGESRGREARLE